MGQAEKEKRRVQEMNLTIRLESPADYRIVEELTREAFWKNADRGALVAKPLTPFVQSCRSMAGFGA